MRIRNYSERTIETYVSMLAGLCKHYDLSPDKINTNQVKDYLQYRIEEHQVSTATVNQMIGSWKILRRDVLGVTDDPIVLKRPRNVYKLPVILSRQEMISILQVNANVKHHTLLCLLYATGLRCSELLALRFADIDSARMVITVRNGKGNKDRQVFIKQDLLDLLRKYYIQYKPEIYLFEGRKPGKPYSETSLGVVVKNSAKKAGINKVISPHTFRHCFATHLIEAGVNLKVVQDLMGHSCIKTTLTYLKLVNIENVSIPNLLQYE